MDAVGVDGCRWCGWWSVLPAVFGGSHVVECVVVTNDKTHMSESAPLCSKLVKY